MGLHGGSISAWLVRVQGFVDGSIGEQGETQLRSLVCCSPLCRILHVCSVPACSVGNSPPLVTGIHHHPDLLGEPLEGFNLPSLPEL